MRKADERRLTMNKMIKQGALAFGLLSGATLLSVPAFANSIHNHGHFGGSRPSHHDRYARYGRDYGYRGYAYGGPRAYYGAPYGYYGDPYYYDDGPRVSFAVPGAGIAFGF
jgi:hypothetical protein